ncbi:hypothetical protein ADK66_17610 [Micromonospora sp. NRRL B-16802]|nr:hypothetical protein ADK66_17610 [Micromonospora sp. NRRL B-16802]
MGGIPRGRRQARGGAEVGLGDGAPVGAEFGDGPGEHDSAVMKHHRPVGPAVTGDRPAIVGAGTLFVLTAL